VQDNIGLYGAPSGYALATRQRIDFFLEKHTIKLGAPGYY